MYLPIAELEINECLLCKSSSLESYDEIEDSLVKELNRYIPSNIKKFPPLINKRKKCDDCGHIFLSPRLDDLSIKKIYEYWYGYAYQAIFTSEKLNSQRLKEFRQYHLKFLSQIKSPGKKLLDVGCGSGLFIHTAKHHGWDVQGIEMDETAAQHGRNTFGVNIKTGTINTALFATDKFDVITLFDYLEHSLMPDEDISHLANHLNPGGILMIRVPNQRGLQSRYMKKNWIALISNHISYFTPDVLGNYLSEKGFIIEKKFARNYQGQMDIFKQRFNWAKNKLLKKYSKQHSAPIIQSEEVTLSSSSMKKLIYSLWIEQLDDVGGLVNQGNNLMIVARKK